MFQMNSMQILVAATLLLGPVLAGYIPPGPKYNCPVDQRPIFPCRCLAGGDDGLRVLCELSGLAPMAAAFSNLGNQPLAKLTISRGRFANFFGAALRPLQVTELLIEDTPIRVVDEHFLEGVNTTLTKVVLNGTKLEAFPTAALALLGDTKVRFFHNYSQ
jgi:hypothetical protein